MLTKCQTLREYFVSKDFGCDKRGFHQKHRGQNLVRPLIVAGSILLVAIIGTIYFKYQDHKMAKQK